MKIIAAKQVNGVVTEHQDTTFNDVYSIYKGRDVELTLERHDKDVVGWKYVCGAVIGNCKNDLMQGDYWAAYDKIF